MAPGARWRPMVRAAACRSPRSGSSFASTGVGTVMTKTSAPAIASASSVSVAVVVRSDRASVSAVRSMPARSAAMRRASWS